MPTAVVTGAGARVGRAIALELAAAGYDVVVHVHTNLQGGRETARLVEALKRRATVVAADLTKEEEAETLFASTLGDAAVVVHAASVFEKTPLATTSAAMIESVIAADLLAPLLVARAAASQLTRTRGALLFVLDIGGVERPWKNYAAYCAARAGLAAAIEVLALELAPNVRVNGIAPGLVLPAKTMDAQEIARRESHIPLGKHGTPDDVSRAVLFLVQAKHITGAILPIDGGRRLA